MRDQVLKHLQSGQRETRTCGSATTTTAAAAHKLHEDGWMDGYTHSALVVVVVSGWGQTCWTKDTYVHTYTCTRRCTLTMHVLYMTLANATSTNKIFFFACRGDTQIVQIIQLLRTGYTVHVSCTQYHAVSLVIHICGVASYTVLSVK